MRRLLGMLAGTFLLGLAFFGTPVSAQIDFGVDFSITLAPAHPAPGSIVRIEAQSALLDLELGEIIWYVNGKEKTRGYGMKTIQLAAPSLGSETLVRASFIEEGLERAAAESVIRPVEIDLLWESDSYAPAWYQGRALPSAGTNLRVEAVPRFLKKNGSFVGNADIVFTWKKNGYVVQNASGRGRYKAILESPALFGTDTIHVEARSADGLFVGEAGAEIASREPILSLYENHPLFGVLYHHALTAENPFADQEISFAAIPYFANAESAQDQSLTYEWNVDGNTIANDPTHPNQITINAEGSSGIAKIGLALSHTTNFYLQVANEWRVMLGERIGIQNPFGSTQ